jgi:hypothetical protein
VRAAGLSGVQADGSVDVRIGSILPTKIQVTAVPSFLKDRRAATITANVFDKEGNPVANVPVIFTVAEGGGSSPPPTTTPTTTPVARGTSAGTLEEFMDSQGTPTFTDNNGQAKDVMRTRADFDAPEKTVTVTATTSTGISNFVTIIINPGNVAPTDPKATSILVSASPPQMTTNRTCTLTAYVYDQDGKLMPGVVVIFSVSSTPPNETLGSGGAPRTTNSSGFATDTVTTADATGATPKTITVTAKTLGTGPTGSVTITATVAP